MQHEQECVADVQVKHFGTFSGSPAKFGAYWVAGGKVIGVFWEGASAEEAAAAKQVVADKAAFTGALPLPAAS